MTKSPSCPTCGGETNRTTSTTFFCPECATSVAVNPRRVPGINPGRFEETVHVVGTDHDSGGTDVRIPRVRHDARRVVALLEQCGYRSVGIQELRTPSGQPIPPVALELGFEPTGRSVLALRVEGSGRTLVLTLLPGSTDMAAVRDDSSSYQLWSLRPEDPELGSRIRSTVAEYRAH